MMARLLAVSGWGAAVLSGVALALAQPVPGWSGLAWLAPGFLLFSSAGADGGTAFRRGYVAGLAYHLIGLRWLLNIPFPAGAVAGWLFLAAYLALFQGVWVWVAWHGLGPGSMGPGSWRTAVKEVVERPWWWRASWVLGVAVLWVALEFVQARFLSGFPWNLLGASQFRMVPLIQVASYAGIAGVSFLVVWVSVSAVLAAIRLLEQPSGRWGWMAELRLPLLMLLSVVCWGMMRLEPDPSQGRSLTVALVQPDIPQEVIWDDRKTGERFERVFRLSELAAASRPDLLVWPESALPSLSEANYRAITNLVGRQGVWMVLGADDAEPRVGATGVRETEWFNAAFLLNPEGRVAGTYRKRHLVIFGEYVPLVQWLPFLRRLTPVEGGFTPGDRPVIFELGEGGVRLSVLICFEDIFAPQAREHVALGADVLLNLTNNGWFGRGSAQWQHAAAAVFRAVENRRPLVRCTNNGLTCWVDRFGRIRQHLGEETGLVHDPGFLNLRLRLPPRGEPAVETFYQRHGDLFSWGCVAATLAGLLPRGGRGWRRAGSSPSGRVG